MSEQHDSGFEYVEYGKLLRGGLEFTELAGTSYLAGKAYFLVDHILAEPLGSTNDVSRFWERTNNFSVAVVYYAEADGYLFTEIQRRHEGQRDDRDVGRPYNQTRFTLLPPTILQDWFKQGYGVYTSLLLDSNTHQAEPQFLSDPERLYVRLKDYRKINLQDKRVTPNLFLANENVPPHPKGQTVSLLWDRWSGARTERIIDDNLLIRALTHLLSGDRIMLLNATKYNFFQRLQICEAFQLLLADVQVVTFALDFVSKQPIDIGFLAAGDRYRDPASAETPLVTLNVNDPITPTTEEQHLQSVLKTIASKKNNQKHWTSFIQEVQKIIGYRKRGSSFVQLDLEIRKGTIALEEIVRILNGDHKKLQEGYLQNILDNPSLWTGAKSPSWEQGQLFIHSLTLLVLQSTYKDILNSYLKRLAFGTLLTWFRANKFSSDFPKVFNSLLSVPSYTELEKLIAEDPQALTLLMGVQNPDFHFLGDKSLYDLLVQHSTRPLIGDFLEHLYETKSDTLVSALEKAVSSDSIKEATKFAERLIAQKQLTLDHVITLRKLYFQKTDQRQLHELTTQNWIVFVKASKIYYDTIAESGQIADDLSVPINQSVFAEFKSHARIDKNIFLALIFFELPILLSTGYQEYEQAISTEFQDLLQLGKNLQDLPDFAAYLINGQKSRPQQTIEIALRALIRPYHDVFFAWALEYFTSSEYHIEENDISYLILGLSNSTNREVFQNALNNLVLKTGSEKLLFLHFERVFDIVAWIRPDFRRNFILHWFKERPLLDLEVFEFIVRYIGEWEPDYFVDDFSNFRKAQQQCRRERSERADSFSFHLIDDFQEAGIAWPLKEYRLDPEMQGSLIRLIIRANLEDEIGLLKTDEDFDYLFRNVQYHQFLAHEINSESVSLSENLVKELIENIVTLNDDLLSSALMRIYLQSENRQYLEQQLQPYFQKGYEISKELGTVILTRSGQTFRKYSPEFCIRLFEASPDHEVWNKETSLILENTLRQFILDGGTVPYKFKSVYKEWAHSNPVSAQNIFDNLREEEIDSAWADFLKSAVPYKSLSKFKILVLGVLRIQIALVVIAIFSILMMAFMVKIFIPTYFGQ